MPISPPPNRYPCQKPATCQVDLSRGAAAVRPVMCLAPGGGKLAMHEADVVLMSYEQLREQLHSAGQSSLLHQFGFWRCVGMGWPVHAVLCCAVLSKPSTAQQYAAVQPPSLSHPEIDVALSCPALHPVFLPPPLPRALVPAAWCLMRRSLWPTPAAWLQSWPAPCGGGMPGWSPARPLHPSWTKSRASRGLGWAAVGH